MVLGCSGGIVAAPAEVGGPPLQQFPVCSGRVRRLHLGDTPGLWAVLLRQLAEAGTSGSAGNTAAGCSASSGDRATAAARFCGGCGGEDGVQGGRRGIYKAAG